MRADERASGRRRSPPVRGRGLKPLDGKHSQPSPKVAPRAGARIETTVAEALDEYDVVAPRAGARIETFSGGGD